jgi:hypothetical protein
MIASKSAILPVLASILVTGSANAAFIIAPTAASTNMGNVSTLVNIINQTGLSSGYFSGVTDFDTYIASNPTHGIVNSTRWFSTTQLGYIDFDLGGLHTIESFALWNVGMTSAANVTQFTLIADDNPAFSSPTALLTNQSANPNNGPTAASFAEVFGFTPVVASYVRLQITSNNGSPLTGVKEVAFEGTVIPEPSPVLLSLVALSAMALRRRR